MTEPSLRLRPMLICVRESYAILIRTLKSHVTRPEERVLSIVPEIPEILVGIQMERSISVSSDRNIRDRLWRWSTYFGRPTEIRRSIFDKPVLCPN